MPFVITIITAVLVAVYLVMDPADSVASIIQLTYLALSFKTFLLIVAGCGFLVAYIVERNFFPWFAKFIGKLHDWALPQRRKKRKEYKLLLEEMRM